MAGVWCRGRGGRGHGQATPGKLRCGLKGDASLFFYPSMLKHVDCAATGRMGSATAPFESAVAWGAGQIRRHRPENRSGHFSDHARQRGRSHRFTERVAPTLRRGKSFAISRQQLSDGIRSHWQPTYRSNSCDWDDPDHTDPARAMPFCRPALQGAASRHATCIMWPNVQRAAARLPVRLPRCTPTNISHRRR